MVAVAALSTIARLIDVPYPILLVARRPRPRPHPRAAGGPARPRPGPRPLPSPAALRGGLLLLAARPAPRPAPDLDAGDRPRAGDRRRGRPRRPRDDRRHALGGRLRARRDPRPHRPARRQRDRPPAGGAAPRGDDHRGREPDQRRHRAGHLPRRGDRRGRRRLHPARRRPRVRPRGGGRESRVGLVVGWVVAKIRKPLEDPPVEITISLATAYAAYLPGRVDRASRASSPRSRRGSTSAGRRRRSPPRTCGSRAGRSGRSLVFLLNAILFVLVGLQLPTCRRRARGDRRADPGRLRGRDLRHGRRGAPALAEPRPRSPPPSSSAAAAGIPWPSPGESGW